MMPVKQVVGKSLLYNRENSWTPESGAGNYDIHEPIPWTADEQNTQVEAALKRIARQDALDKFIQSTYNNINDYRALMVRNLTKKVTRYLEDQVVYGDTTYGSAKQFNGLHALNQGFEAVTAVASLVGNELNIDGGETVLSLDTLRRLLDSCKVEQRGRNGVYILMGRNLARRISEGYQESAFVRASVTVSLSSLIIGAKEIGGRVLMFDGVPILVSDILVAEQANTGAGTNKRAKRTSGTRQYSIFVCRLGPLEEGGLEMLFGSDSARDGEFAGFMHTSFPVLENFDAGGERLVSYPGLALGAGYSLGRIFDLTDGNVVP